MKVEFCKNASYDPQEHEDITEDNFDHVPSSDDTKRP